MDLQTNKTNLNQLVNLNGWSISWIGWWWRYMKQNAWWCTAPNDIFPLCLFNIHTSPHLLWTSLIHYNVTTLSLEEKLALTLPPLPPTLTASNTELSNSGSNKHDNSSSLGMVNELDWTNWYLFTSKVTVTFGYNDLNYIRS